MKNALLKSFAVLTTFVLTLLSPISGKADDYLYADVNRDGEVTISDVNAVIDVILGYGVDPSQYNKTFMANGVSFTMVKVNGGKFNMGAADDDAEARPDEHPSHVVQLSDYYIGQTEVTQELWDAVMGIQPSAFTGNNKPVESVSWEDCKEFIRKLNTITGMQFRFPTEAEWVFAARGGNKSCGYKYAGSNDLNEVGWWGFEKGGNNTNYTTQNVAQLAPNELGIYDMSGNVFEWCNDWYGGYPKPAVHVNQSTIIFEDIKEGSSNTSATFTVKGYHLSDKVYIDVEGNGFSVSPQVINANEANDNYVSVTVTYSGPREELSKGMVTISSKNADSRKVYLRYHCPELDVYSNNPLVLQDMVIENDTIVTGMFSVSGKNLIDTVKISIDGNGFSIDPQYILPDNNGKVVEKKVTVTYSGNSTEPVTGLITVKSSEATEQTITVIAQKTIPGNETEPSLDMYKNICEQDQDYEGYIDVNPTGPTSGNYRVIRGGSWNTEARFCRSSYRYNNKPDFKHYSIGLRLAL